MTASPATQFAIGELTHTIDGIVFAPNSTGFGWKLVFGIFLWHWIYGYFLGTIYNPLPADESTQA